MRKTRPERPKLKVTSLSELRSLHQQAAKQTRDAVSNGGSSDAAQSGGGDGGGATPRRKPHRFLPPGRGAVPIVRNKPEKPDPVASTSATRPVRADDSGTLPDRTPSAGTSSAGTHAQTLGPGKAGETTVILDEDDVALFRRVVQSVTPARDSNRAMLPPIPSATPQQLKQRRQHAMGQAVNAALDVSDHYTLARIHHNDTEFLQSGHGPHLIKGLKKGKWPIQASLDLHGANLDEARERMDRFIQSCRDHQIKCVRIVHGKGHGSLNGDAILKETVRRWLSQLAVVQAYVECAESEGGAGAVLVLLSKSDA